MPDKDGYMTQEEYEARKRGEAMRKPIPTYPKYDPYSEPDYPSPKNNSSRIILIGIVILILVFGYLALNDKFKSDVSLSYSSNLSCPNIPACPSCNFSCPPLSCPGCPACPSTLNVYVHNSS